MIKGKLDGHEFIFRDGEASSNDAATMEYVKNLWRAITIGFQPQDGDPELYLLEYLEKSGAKDLQHTPEYEMEGVIY